MTRQKAKPSENDYLELGMELYFIDPTKFYMLETPRSKNWFMEYMKKNETFDYERPHFVIGFWDSTGGQYGQIGFYMLSGNRKSFETYSEAETTVKDLLLEDANKHRKYFIAQVISATEFETQKPPIV